MGWITTIKQYDRQSLTDLTSVGLVRRAGKQAGAVKPVPTDTSDDRGVFVVGDHSVALKDAPLSEAVCDCRVVGVCVHILAAVLSVQQSTAADTPEIAAEADVSREDLETEISELAPERLFRWAGKPATRKALQLLAKHPENGRRIVHGESSLEIVLGPDDRCRYVAGGGLEGVICEAPDSRRKGVVLACLIHWRQQRGMDIPWPGDPGAGGTGSLGLSEEERRLVHAVKDHLTAMLTVGLMHLPRPREDALRDLALSSRGNRMPRLGAMLLQLNGELSALRKASSGAGSQKVFDLVALVYVLCEAMLRSPVDAVEKLRGHFRRDYRPQETGPLWLAGAYLYETLSDARGLSLVFWNLQNNQPLQVNCGRAGEAARNFDPAAAWHAALGWRKGRAPSELNNKVATLKTAKVSLDGRLSLSAETLLEKVTDAGKHTAAIEKMGCRHWDRLCRDLAGELQKPMPVLRPVLARPNRLKPMQLDEIEQMWVGWIRDGEGRWLRLDLPVSRQHNRRVAALNQRIGAGRSGIWGLVLEPRMFQQRLCLMPVSLVAKTGQGFDGLHPDLASLEDKKPPGLGKLIKDLIPGRKKGPPQPQMSQQPASAPVNLIDQIQDMILGAAEIGLDCAYLERGQTLSLADDLAGAGAGQLAGVIRRLADRQDAQTLVRANYAIQLARRRLQISNLIDWTE